MAYIVKLGTFAKKKNSTAQPDTSGWASFNSVLKQGSELTNPTLQLRMEESDLVNYNYAYMFGSYYWITSRKMVRNDLAEIGLEKDKLATYKTAIGNTNLYIVRSSVSYNGSIKDAFYPMIAQRSIANSTILDSTQKTLSDGCYVVNIMGMNTATSTLYLMTPNEFNLFIKALYSAINGVIGANFLQAAVNAVLDPMQYIRSVIWLPFSKATAETAFGALPSQDEYGQAINIFCGIWDSGNQGEYLSTCASIVADWSIPLTKHPQAAARGKFLNCAPYTDHIIEFPPFGSIHVNPDKLIDSQYLNIELAVDAITGMGILQAAGDNSTGVIASVSAQYGVPVPLSGASANMPAISSAIAGTAELIAGIATENPLLAVAGASQGIKGLAESAQAVVSSSGSAGSMAAYQVPKYFYTTYYEVAPEDNTNNGRPLCQMQNPANLGGYMVAEKAPLSISCTRPELEEIQRYITTGFYYE